MKEKIPAVGKKFAVEVAAGIEVVTVLASADFYDELDVTAIDLSNLGGRRSRTESEIVVWTATRAAITWGRSTAYAKFGELPVADKLKNLEKINGQRPGLRGLHTVRLEFDVNETHVLEIGAGGSVDRIEKGGCVGEIEPIRVG